jgi:hypothetical protein
VPIYSLAKAYFGNMKSSNIIGSATAKAILGTYRQEFETLFAHHKSLAPGQRIPFSRFTSLSDFRATIQESLSDLEIEAKTEDFYAELSYHAALLNDFAREKKIFLALDGTLSERTIAEWLQRMVSAEVIKGMDWHYMNQFLLSDDAKQMSWEQKRLYLMLLTNECLRKFGLTIQIWMNDNDETKDAAFITTVEDANNLENLLLDIEYSVFIAISSLDDYQFMISDDTLPLTKDEQRTVQKKMKEVKIVLFLFVPLFVFFAFLFFRTLSDPYFRTSDGYYVAGFTGLVAFAAAMLILKSVSETRILKRVLANGRKKIIFGKVEEVIVLGSLRAPEVSLKIATKLEPLQVRILNKNSLSGVNSFLEIKKGDRVTLHQAAQEPMTLSVQVVPS